MISDNGNGDDATPEEWRLEWQNYFDDLDASVERMDKLAVKAFELGFAETGEALMSAATAIIKHCQMCENFLATQQTEMIINMYKQNPLLKVLYEKTGWPFANPADSPYTEPIKDADH